MDDTSLPALPAATTDSSGEQSSAAESRGSSPLCWAANLSAAATNGLTVYFLGVPVWKTFLKSLADRDFYVAGLSFCAVYMITRTSGAADIAKVLTAVKGLVPGSKA